MFPLSHLPSTTPTLLNYTCPHFLVIFGIESIPSALLQDPIAVVPTHIVIVSWTKVSLTILYHKASITLFNSANHEKG